MWKKLVAVVTGAVLASWFLDDFNPDDVRGKTVLVTGASTGIGEQMAYHYARLGASVVVTARRENRLKEVVAECRKLGSADQKFGYVVADMSDLDSTGPLIQETVRKLGHLDILVLNHIILLGLGPWEGSAGNLTLVDKVLKINFQSYVYLASHALPHLETTGGSIMVVSSIAGKLATPMVTLYSASKFALDGFFSSLRQELRLKQSKVSITLCILGLISTDNAMNNLKASGQSSVLENVAASTPSDTALAMIKEGVSRPREIYFPRMSAQSVVVLRDLLTSVLEYAVRSVYTVS